MLKIETFMPTSNCKAAGRFQLYSDITYQNCRKLLTNGWLLKKKKKNQALAPFDGSIPSL